MQFCPKCGARLRFKKLKSEDKTVPANVCERCGYQSETSGTFAKPEQATTQSQIKVIGDEHRDLKTMPTMAIECSKCQNNEAYWWLVQTRSGDEATTQFYRCTKCEFTWRSYA
ncbi:MAG: transcription factor S [Thaumarchaeota archaeon]|nr:transcription factor S [Nitrososphaerota archaeon]